MRKFWVQMRVRHGPVAPRSPTVYEMPALTCQSSFSPAIAGPRRFGVGHFAREPSQRTSGGAEDAFAGHFNDLATLRGIVSVLAEGLSTCIPGDYAWSRTQLGAWFN